MNDFTNKTRNRLLVAFALFLVVYGGWVVVYNVSGASAEDKAKQALTAKIVADPLNPSSILNQENEQRAKINAQPFSMNPELVRSAQQKCNDMVEKNYFEHARPGDGKKGSDWVKENTKNWKFTNENLLRGDLDASFQAVDSWLASPAHKTAMLDAKWTDTGIALCTDNTGADLVVQHFAVYYTQAEVQASQPAPTPQPATRTISPYYTPPVNCTSTPYYDIDGSVKRTYTRCN